MIDIKEKYFDLLKEILKRHVPEYEIRVFGSRIKGTAKNHSDLDIALVGKEKISYKTLNCLKNDLDDSDIPFNIDILDWNSINENFKNVINDHYEILTI
jgi:predicted nucleotidyltransferase